jgi:L-amino acid N-acyltransferase YncA
MRHRHHHRLRRPTDMKIELREPADRHSGQADAEVSIVADDGKTLAACSLWLGAATGILGQFTADTAAAATVLFEAAEKRLREAGCTSVIGPMDGDTWRPYRLVTAGDGRPPFLLEPQNPAEWPGYFLAAGWHRLARYSSSEIDLTRGAPQAAIDRVERRMDRTGVSIRQVDPGNFADALRRIYEVSLVSFQGNFLYSPISFEDFSAMYSKVRPLLVPEFALLAEDAEGHPVGFVFAIPEPTDPVGTVIVKTLAVLPEKRIAGLGSLLVERVHASAERLGFKHSIHALQHQDNTSKKISARHAAKVFREYTLYEKHL